MIIAGNLKNAIITRVFSSVGLEHLPYKQGVDGSNPSTLTIFYKIIKYLYMFSYFIIDWKKCTYRQAVKSSPLYFWEMMLSQILSNIWNNPI